MNAAGGRKPYDLSIVEYLRIIWSTPNRETHLVDWLLSRFGVFPEAPVATLLLFIVGLLGAAFILKLARNQEV